MEPTTFALKAMRSAAMSHGGATRRAARRCKFFFPEGRALQAKLVPLAEEVNDVALRGVGAADIAATRRTLLALITNLAADEKVAPTSLRRIPSTRELSRLARSARAGRRMP
jgi:hypothetical protein